MREAMLGYGPSALTTLRNPSLPAVGGPIWAPVDCPHSVSCANVQLLVAAAPGDSHDHGKIRRGADARRPRDRHGRADALLLAPGGPLLRAGARRRAGAPQAAGREADRLP